VIAKVPDLTAMQAKLLVIDKYAIGLGEGNHVDVTLDANPSLKITGKVTAVSGFPRSIKRGNPVKYFEVTVALDNPDGFELMPGQKVTANIQVDKYEDKLSVPLQAIYNDQGEIFVYVENNGDVEKRVVNLGVKSLYEAEVIAGLEAGDRVVLNVPEVHRG
jgi:multidrug efflux pump subunit AcrA (membrane-fusion protein)